MGLFVALILLQLPHELHFFPTLQLHGAHVALAASAMMLPSPLSHQCCSSGHGSCYTQCWLLQSLLQAISSTILAVSRSAATAFVHVHTPDSGISKFCSPVSQSINPALLFLISPLYLPIATSPLSSKAPLCSLRQAESLSRFTSSS